MRLSSQSLPQLLRPLNLVGKGLRGLAILGELLLLGVGFARSFGWGTLAAATVILLAAKNIHRSNVFALTPETAFLKSFLEAPSSSFAPPSSESETSLESSSGSSLGARRTLVSSRRAFLESDFPLALGADFRLLPTEALFVAIFAATGVELDGGEVCWLEMEIPTPNV